MSESEKWQRIGEAFGRGIAEGIKSTGLDDAVRGLFAFVYGKCRMCDQPLGGSSPDQVCETCHASEVLATALDTTAPKAEA